MTIERSKLLINKGFTDDKQGFDAYLSSLAEDYSSVVEQTWLELQELLRACQDQNLTNGQILENSRRNTEKALSLLVGKGEEGDIDLYDEKGSTHRPFGGQSHVKV